MVYITSILSGIVSGYIMLICIRILLTWFPGANFGGIMYFLQSICDPYLNWWRRFRVFRNGPIDFSPLLAVGALSILRGVLGVWSLMGRPRLGMILALIIGTLWSIISWLLGFLIIILILRLIAFLGNRNIYSPFWRFVDMIAQPVMYRICRILFPSRILSYLARIIISTTVLLLLFAALWIASSFGAGLLRSLPV